MFFVSTIKRKDMMNLKQILQKVLLSDILFLLSCQIFSPLQAKAENMHVMPFASFAIIHLPKLDGELI